MHGLIHAELRKFVETTHGAAAWPTVLAEAGLDGKLYLANPAYPDSETVAIVSAASRITGTPLEAILEAFGEFAVPTFMRMHQALIKPTWRTMELLLNTEEAIHAVVRARNPGCHPPRLDFVRTGEDTLRF